MRGGFIEVPRQRGGGRVPFTEAELTAIRGGLTAEQYRRRPFCYEPDLAPDPSFCHDALEAEGFTCAP